MKKGGQLSKHYRRKLKMAYGKAEILHPPTHNILVYPGDYEGGVAECAGSY